VLAHGKALHRHFIFFGDIRQGQCSVDRQALFGGMAAEQLQLGTDDALLREIGDELMSEEMRIDPLGQAGGVRILFDDLPETPGGVRLTAIGLKEIEPPGGLLTFHVLREFATETRGKEDLAILVAFPLGDAELTRREIHIREAETH
jgi:hypothetical protein